MKTLIPKQPIAIDSDHEEFELTGEAPAGTKRILVWIAREASGADVYWPESVTVKTHLGTRDATAKGSSTGGVRKNDRTGDVRWYALGLTLPRFDKPTIFIFTAILERGDRLVSEVLVEYEEWQ